LASTNSLFTASVVEADGEITQEQRDALYRLVRIWDARLERNRLRRDFFEMHVNVKNIGIALSDEMVRKLDASCGWPRKAVCMPAERSRIDGWTFESGRPSDALLRIMRDNSFGAKYDMASQSELTHGLMCWTLSRAEVGRSKVQIKTHSAETSAVEWDGRLERVRDGMAIIDTRPLWPRSYTMTPCAVNLYTDDATIVLTLDDDNIHWHARAEKNPMGRPLIEPMVFQPSVTRPLGQSRITRAVMSIVMRKLRNDMRSEVGAEIFTTPQKFLLGATDEAFDMDRYESYMGNIFLAGKDEDGDVPKFGQLPQGTMQPLTDYSRSLAAEFSGETSIPITSLGIIHDQPASAEAMENAERDMVQLVERMNKTNGQALRNVAMMALAIDDGPGRSLESLSEDEYGVHVRWGDPAMPNRAAEADRWTKLASVAPWVTETEEFLTGFGVPEEVRFSMLAQKRRLEGRGFVLGGIGGNDTDGGAAPLQRGSGGGATAGGGQLVEGLVPPSGQGNGGLVS